MSHRRIHSLRLYNFRNYAHTTVQLAPNLNVFVGDNAQGKTNLLEAVATLCLTRSPRASAAADVLRWGENECGVDALVDTPNSPVRLQLRLQRDPVTDRVTRTTSVDGKSQPARALLGVCPVVLFWPDDLQLVKAGPDGRRQLLDTLLAQLDPVSAQQLLAFRRTLEQRNTLLRRLRDDGGDVAALDAFDRSFIEAGAHLRAARAALAGALTPQAHAALRRVGSDNEQLELAYVGSDGTAFGTDRDEAAAQLRDHVARMRSAEIARGQSLVGPQRDDLAITLAGRPAKTSASQGQQRSIVLALKLAEVSYIRATTDATPLLVLDDVLSELDAARREALLQAIAEFGMQTLLTTTDPVASGELGSGAQSFAVTAGSVATSVPAI